jgi:hypothetical protein
VAFVPPTAAGGTIINGEFQSGLKQTFILLFPE